MRRGLGALYLSDHRVTLNGLAASAWGDRVGSLDVSQGTGASQPTVVPFATGARTALRFDGTNDQMSRAIATGLNASTRGLTIVFVAQGRSGSSGDFPVIVSARAWLASLEQGYAICANGTSVSGKLSAHFADGTNGFDHGSANATASRGLSTTQRELWCVVFDDVNDRLRWYRNGVLDTDAAPAWPTATPTAAVDFRIGAAPAPAATRWCAMDLYALAMHTEPLSAAEVAAYAAAWMPLFGVRS